MAAAEMEAKTSFVYLRESDGRKCHVSPGMRCGPEVFKGREELFREVDEPQPEPKVSARKSKSKSG